MNGERLMDFLKRIHPRRGVLICHPNADPDAIFSAYALSRILSKAHPPIATEIFPIEGVSEATKSLLEKVRVELAESPNLRETDFIGLVDTSSISQLGSLRGEIEALEKPLVVVDHHTPHPTLEEKASLMIIEENTPSACEVVYWMGVELGHRWEREEALALFMGIAYETRRFQLATPQTFKAVAHLVSLGIEPREALGSLTRIPPRSERFARLKAAQRLQFEEVGGWIVAHSHVNAYEASAARALITLGADLAIVASERRGEVRLSLRSTEEFLRGAGVHLGKDLAIPLGETLGGVGGGHPSAAGVEGKGDPRRAVEDSLKLLREKVKPRPAAEPE